MPHLHFTAAPDRQFPDILARFTTSRTGRLAFAQLGLDVRNSMPGTSDRDNTFLELTYERRHRGGGW